MPFRCLQKVRFGDVDHAKIVYYPRILNYFHIAFEESFGEDGYRHILDDRKIGFPAVKIECEFKKPLRFGDVIAVDIHPERIGTKSVTLRYVVSRVGDESGEASATCKMTYAVIGMDSFRAIPLPTDLRTHFEALR